MEVKVAIEVLQKQKIFLAVPMYGGMNHGMFCRSIADLSTECTKLGIQLQLYMLFNESLITRARNYCVDEFLRSDATHLMFIDSDIGFAAKDVISLLAMMCQDETNEYDVIGGPYPKKCISWEKIRLAVDKGYGDPRNPDPALRDPAILERFVGDYVFNPKGGVPEIKISEPCEVLETGTGFMMIRRKTFEKFAAFFPERTYRPDHARQAHFDGSREIMMYFQADIEKMYLFHKAMVRIRDMTDLADVKKLCDETFKSFESGSKRYLSEDYLFCQDVQTAGMKVWFCPWIQLAHAGSFVFAGSLADIAAIGAPATVDSQQLRGQVPPLQKVPPLVHKPPAPGPKVNREDKQAILNRLRQNAAAGKRPFNSDKPVPPGTNPPPPGILANPGVAG